MRPVIVAANWKMNTTPASAGSLAQTIAGATARATSVVRVICPPYVALAEVRAALDGSGVWVGAQNVHAEEAGAYTGEISASMLRGLADWVIVGHSERRRDQCETDELVARKLGRALAASLTPILCVGEQLVEREAGAAGAVVRRQVSGALARIDGDDAVRLADARHGRPWLVVAYEPVWAIGTGRTARASDAVAMADLIRETAGLALGSVGARLPVLYGGSVTSTTIAEFLGEPALDGALVGGASLKVDEMGAICARAALTADARLARGMAS